MGGACGTYGGEERSNTGLWWRNLKERDHWEDLGVNGRTVKIDLKEIGHKGVDWIDLFQEGDNWPAVVSTVMNFRVA
jgi:hypothetical protein